MLTNVIVSSPAISVDHLLPEQEPKVVIFSDGLSTTRPLGAVVGFGPTLRQKIIAGAATARKDKLRSRMTAKFGVRVQISSIPDVST